MLVFGNKKREAEVSRTPGAEVLRGLQHGRLGETISLGKTTNSWPWASLPPPSSVLGPLHT